MAAIFQPATVQPSSSATSAATRYAASVSGGTRRASRPLCWRPSRRSVARSVASSRCADRSMGVSLLVSGRRKDRGLMRTQTEKGQIFRELHARQGILLLPNPWDAGTAKLLQSLGFEAQATDLPVNADLENGYADDPKEAATILRDAAEAGVVGGSIEDWSGEKIYDFDLAVERVAAGVEMARSLKVPFTFTARAENLIRGVNDLDDTIKRLKAFEKAGADVLYAPGLRDLKTMKMVIAEIGKPLNVVMSAGDPDLTAEQLASVGVKRVSVGGALSRLALAAFMKGAREMKERGGFTWMRETMPTAELKKVFRAD